MSCSNARRLTSRAAVVPVLFSFALSACSDDSSSSPGTNGSTTVTGTQTVTASVTSTTTAAASTTSTTTSATVSSTTGATTTDGGTVTSTTATAVTTTTTTTTGSDTTSTTSAGGATGTTTGVSGAGGTTSTTGGTNTAVVSDDFESVAAGGPPDAALWQLRVPGGGNSIEITTEQAHSGAQSVKVTGASGSTMFFNESAFPLPSGVIYFRVWMRFTDANWANHNAFVASSPGGQESQEVRFGGQNNAYNANLAADGDGLSPDPFEYPSCERCVAPVADEWKCLRGKFDFTGNTAELYVGDALAVDSATDGWHSGSGTFPQDPTQIGFGWALYGANANTVYYDDLALGYEPIACE